MCKRKPLGSVKRVSRSMENEYWAWRSLWRAAVQTPSKWSDRKWWSRLDWVATMRTLLFSNYVFMWTERETRGLSILFHFFLHHFMCVWCWRCLSRQSNRFLCVRHGFLVDSLECVLKWTNLEADDTKKPNNNIIRLSISRIKLNLTIITVITLELR